MQSPLTHELLAGHWGCPVGSLEPARRSVSRAAVGLDSHLTASYTDKATNAGAVILRHRPVTASPYGLW